ncbi:MAG: hypothetical protein IT381_09030 [Deltaproteobacteria bacterium]|nr:hypothetical protein [Deltaproteobacteria bacterium]
MRAAPLALILLIGCSLRFGATSERFPAVVEQDSDGDGLSDRAERRIGTNPFSTDSDGDGIADNLEIGDPNNPVDSNGDGLIDALDDGTLTILPSVSDLPPPAGGSGSTGSMGGTGSTGGTGGTTGSTGTSGGVDPYTIGPPSVIPGFCGGVGALTTVEGVDVCGGDLAKVIFKYGLCVCGDAPSGSFPQDLMLSNNFGATSLDVKDGNGNPIGQAGNIGVNGDLSVSGNEDILGSVLIQGRPSCIGGGSLDVSQILQYGTGAANDTNCSGSKLTSAHTIVRKDDLPCDYCGAQTLPVSTIIASFASNNDNAARGLANTTFLTNTASPVTLPLECGVYYFTNITPQASFTLNISGRVAIFVPGDVISSGNGFAINFSGPGELDLFVGGIFRLQGQSNIGDLNNPARFRVYVGGSEFSAANNSTLNGFFYAPNVPFVFNNLTKVNGGLVTKTAKTAGNATIAFDKGVFSLEGCVEPLPPPVQGGDPPPACTSNLQCGGGNPVCNAATGQCVDCNAPGGACDGPFVCDTIAAGESNYAMYCGSDPMCTACVTPDTCVGEGCFPP